MPSFAWSCSWSLPIRPDSAERSAEILPALILAMPDHPLLPAVLWLCAYRTTRAGRLVHGLLVAVLILVECLGAIIPFGWYWRRTGTLSLSWLGCRVCRAQVLSAEDLEAWALRAEGNHSDDRTT